MGKLTRFDKGHTPGLKVVVSRIGQESSAAPCFAGALAQRSTANNGWGVDGPAGGNNVRVYGPPGGRRALGAQNSALHSRSGAVESRWGSFGERPATMYS